MIYVVFAADTYRVARAVQQRRVDVVLQLDKALAAIVRRHSGPEVGGERDEAVDRVRDVPQTLTLVEVVLFTANQGLARLGAMRPAGHITKGDVPKVPVGHFDLVNCMRGLKNEQDRDAAAMTRRGITLWDTHIILITTDAPLADAESIERLEELCFGAQVIWILINVDPGLMSAEFAATGAVVLDEHSDVVQEILEVAFDVSAALESDAADEADAQVSPHPAESGSGADETGSLGPNDAGHSASSASQPPSP